MRTANFNIKLLATLLFLIFNQLPAYPQSIPLHNGFAHNDYWHKRPLFDALENGFRYIEADIFLVDGQLVVAHVFPFFKSGRTLEKLYLQPLLEQVNSKRQPYVNTDAPVTLMIDIKTGANSTYEALKPLLDKYRSIISSYENGRFVQRAVTIVLSGRKPLRMVKQEASRMVFIDEDLRRMDRDSLGTAVYPMTSCNYNSFLKWDGKGEMPVAERQKLCAYIKLAHRYGKKVRLWSSPENRVVWAELLRCGVDLINTDRLADLKNFLNTTWASNVN
jgi:glycerophosphoryl diester phosphodiesterase